MRYTLYNIKKQDNEAIATYMKLSLRHFIHRIQHIFFLLGTYLKPSKFISFAMLLPMTLVMLSGFIYEKEPPFSKTFPLTPKTLYPLSENYLPMLYAPQSGMIPVKHEIDSFFKQFAPHDVPGHLYVHELRTPKPITHESPHNINKQDENNLLFPQPENTIVVFEDKHAKEPDFNLILPTKQIDPHNAPQSYASRKRAYAPYIYKYAKKYNLDPKLVIAIIYTESHFIPHLISTRNAHGLMQVVPETAGAEVNRFFKKEGEPAGSELIHPETNIRYGTAYLYLLRKYHLTGIHNARTKDLITIASYNAGSGAVLRHFGPTRLEAIAKINSMTPDEIYESIFFSFRSNETRRYIAKVTNHMAIL